MKKLIIASALVLSLGGCHSVPESIQVPEGINLVMLEQVLQAESPDALSRQPARWAGKIAQIRNLESYSEIEVVAFPTSSSGKPQTTKNSPGRFIAKVDGFIEPHVFTEGRLITIVGEVSGKSDGMIGEMAYQFPTLDAEGYFLWQTSSDYTVQTIGGFVPFSRYGRSRFVWDPIWGYHPQHIRIKKNDEPSRSGRVKNAENRANEPTRVIK